MILVTTGAIEMEEGGSFKYLGPFPFIHVRMDRAEKFDRKGNWIKFLRARAWISIIQFFLFIFCIFINS